VPRYRFEFAGNIEQGTTEVDLPDARTARREAVQAAREAMMEGYIASSTDMSKRQWMVRVYDEAGYLVVTVAFADLEHPEGREDEQ
jgi:hypothetical protein